MVKGTSILGVHFEVRRYSQAVNSFNQWITLTPPLSSGIVRFIGLFFCVFYLQLYAITRGVDPELSFYAVSRSVMCFPPSFWAWINQLSVLNAASFFGRIIPGAIAHKIGVFNLGTAFAFGTGVILLTMITVKDFAGTMVFAILLGLFSGACIALMPAILGKYPTS